MEIVKAPKKMRKQAIINSTHHNKDTKPPFMGSLQKTKGDDNSWNIVFVQFLFEIENSQNISFLSRCIIFITCSMNAWDMFIWASTNVIGKSQEDATCVKGTTDAKINKNIYVFGNQMRACPLFSLWKSKTFVRLQDHNGTMVSSAYCS